MEDDHLADEGFKQPCQDRDSSCTSTSELSRSEIRYFDAGDWSHVCLLKLKVHHLHWQPELAVLGCAERQCAWKAEVFQWFCEDTSQCFQEYGDPLEAGQLPRGIPLPKSMSLPEGRAD